MRAVTLTAAITIALAAAGGTAQELSTDVYPSEDDLLEALRRGDIDQERYDILREILREGIDQPSRYLFNEIPNLAGEERADTALPRLAAEQAEAFTAKRPPAPRLAVRHRYAQEIERSGRGSYRTTVSGRLGPHLDGAVRLERTVSGRERVVGRMIRWRPERGVICEAAVGSLARRLGLGTVAGYRGKILGSSPRLDGESVRYPDYGGQNGGYVRALAGRWQAEALVSHTRDGEFTLLSAAVAVARRCGKVRAASIAGINRLRSRVRGEPRSDVKYAGLLEYAYGNGRIAAEAAGQAGVRSAFGAVVFEGRHRLTGAEIRYCGWHYDRDYVDLAGGSAGGTIAARDSIPGPAFAFSSRRTGNTGATVRTEAALTARVALETGVAGSIRSSDTLRGEVLAGLIAAASRALQVRADHLERLTRTRESLYDRDAVVRRTRAEVRYGRAALAVRTYVGYTVRSGAADSWNWFARLRYRSARVGDLEIWANLGTISPARRQIDYAYGYVQLRQMIGEAVAIAVKIAQRYSRGADDPHRTTVALEAEAVL